MYTQQLKYKQYLRQSNSGQGQDPLYTFTAVAHGRNIKERDPYVCQHVKINTVCNKYCIMQV